VTSKKDANATRCQGGSITAMHCLSKPKEKIKDYQVKGGRKTSIKNGLVALDYNPLNQGGGIQLE